jgi:hypothetical protein
LDKYIGKRGLGGARQGIPKGSSRQTSQRLSGVASSPRRRYGDTPLDYMLAVMNDPDAPPRRRDKIAKAALPYMHQRLGKRRW